MPKKPEPKSYNDARGMVTADYQNYLEKNWIESLPNFLQLVRYN